MSPGFDPRPLLSDDGRRDDVDAEAGVAGVRPPAFVERRIKSFYGRSTVKWAWRYHNANFLLGGDALSPRFFNLVCKRRSKNGPARRG